MSRGTRIRARRKRPGFFIFFIPYSILFIALLCSNSRENPRRKDPERCDGGRECGKRSPGRGFEKKTQITIEKAVKIFLCAIIV
jgi:hypothetical protein